MEEKTKNVTLINTFTSLVADQFPTEPRKFSVYAALTDGQGRGTITLMLARLDDGMTIYEYRNSIVFPTRHVEVRASFRVTQCTFPSPGDYQATLLIDGQWVAQRQFKVIQRST